MRIIKTDSLRPGTKLTKGVKTYDGRVVMSAGTVLTDALIEKMKGFGVHHLFIEDDAYGDAEFKPALSDETRLELMQTMDKLFTSIKKQQKINTDMLKHSAKDLLTDTYKSLLDDPINLFSLFTVKDPRVEHAINVASMVAALAISKGCSTAVIEESVQAALLHDAFLENMSLDDDYISHAAECSEYVKQSRVFSVRVYQGIAAHHEKFDGSGLPKELAGDMITEIARMIAVADMYDNLINGYGYPKLDINYAAEYITAESGKALDPELVDAFNHNIAIYPTGATVKLSNGLAAVIIGQNKNMIRRPIVKVVSDAPEERIVINMMSKVNSSLFIEHVDL